MALKVSAFLFHRYRSDGASLRHKFLFLVDAHFGMALEKEAPLLFFNIAPGFSEGPGANDPRLKKAIINCGLTVDNVD